MNGMQPRELEKLDPKKELEKAKIQMHNLLLSKQLLEVQIKKLEELSR